MYKVLKEFADLQDNKHLYRAGDVFPRAGVKVSEDRVAELASTRNRCREVLIEAVQNGKIQPESAENDSNKVVIKTEQKKPKKRKKKEI